MKRIKKGTEEKIKAGQRSGRRRGEEKRRKKRDDCGPGNINK